MGNAFIKIFLEKRDKFNQSCEERLRTWEFPKGIKEYSNIPYAEDNKPEHRMDIYRPDNQDGQVLPVIINVHGGGMILGSKEFNRYFCAEVCKHGFLIFSIEYSLVPEVQVYTQFGELSLAMDKIEEMIPQYGGDKEHVYVVADSAGAYISTYTVAMQRSKALAEAAGVKPSALNINALGLISGMFYTTRFDEIGLFMPKYLYGEKYKKSAFAPYINPEHRDIVTSLPPCYLITSRNDNLRHYTLDFEKALSRHQMPHELLYYEEKNSRLTHAFSVFEPFMEESGDAISKLVQFLKKY